MPAGRKYFWRQLKKIDHSPHISRSSFLPLHQLFSRFFFSLVPRRRFSYVAIENQCICLRTIWRHKIEIWSEYSKRCNRWALFLLQQCSKWNERNVETEGGGAELNLPLSYTQFLCTCYFPTHFFFQTKLPPMPFCVYLFIYFFFLRGEGGGEGFPATCFFFSSVSWHLQVYAFTIFYRTKVISYCFGFSAHIYAAEEK